MTVPTVVWSMDPMRAACSPLLPVSKPIYTSACVRQRIPVMLLMAKGDKDIQQLKWNADSNAALDRVHG